MSDKGTETKTNLRFTPEAEAVLANELSGFLELLLPRERQAQGTLLDIFATPGQVLPEQVPGLDATTGITREALAGIMGDLAPRDVGNIQTGIGEEANTLAEAFRQLALQTAASQQTFVDPRFAQILAPTTSSKTGPTTTQQAIDAAKAVASIAASYAT